MLGFRVGQDSMLASWRQINDYFTRLAATSPMVRLDTLGPTVQGRPFLLVTISDPSNLARREQLMRAQRQLADPRTLSAPDEERLVAEQPAVILINCSIHSTEIAASQMSMELAWRLVTDPTRREWLRRVVVLLVPSANPDGIDIVGDWYRASRFTAWDGTSPPWLYHPYVGHDNNRDWFMLTQPETRHLTRVLYREWFPLVFYDVHQMGSSGARLFVPPFSDPVNPNLDPAIVAGMNLVGASMAQALIDDGYTGVAHQTAYDLWWHGGARSTPTRHNMVGILSEAASARIASPNCMNPAQIRQPPRGVNYPAPWEPRCWRLRDIVDYELVAAQALVRLAHDQRAEFVRRFVAANRRAIQAGRTQSPHAYVLPPVGDPWRRALLANLLIASGIEVLEARSHLTAAGGRAFPAGTLVVPMAQSFRSHAKDLLERQRYPERRLFPGGPQIPPYDVAGWTLPLQMGVAAEAVDSLSGGDLAALDTVRVAPGSIAGQGDVVLLDNTHNGHITAVWAALRAGSRVEIADRQFEAEGRTWPAGTLVLRGGRAAVEQAARRFGFTAVATRRLAEVAPAVRAVPRLGLYRSWNGSMDEGWTRWVLEQLEVPYVTLTDSAVRAGNLGASFDVIILPSESEQQILAGRRAGTAPARYTGGLGEPGVAALRRFVEEGGTLIALDAATRFAINRLGAPARYVRTTRGGTAPSDEPGTPEDTGSVSRFYAPGSIFDVNADPLHPIASGIGPRAAVYFMSSQILEPGVGARAVLTYPADRDVLLSGYVDGEEVLRNRAALIEAPLGRGRVVLFGFRPQHRGQTHATFRLLTNAILYGSRR
ncbi:MAG TPA: M14 metallopeptidase family protein [Gemmatimonadales bacterium]|nr:M14 metallopeptidase family protein [Gemmatimonadales bacterium]